jgi:hypothetical protein
LHTPRTNDTTFNETVGTPTPNPSAGDTGWNVVERDGLDMILATRRKSAGTPP